MKPRDIGELQEALGCSFSQLGLLEQALTHSSQAREWEALRRWSIEKADAFWEELLEFVGIEPSRPAGKVMSGQGMLGTKWFEGMTLSAVRNGESGACTLIAGPVGEGGGRNPGRLSGLVIGPAASVPSPAWPASSAAPAPNYQAATLSARRPARTSGSGRC